MLSRSRIVTRLLAGFTLVLLTTLLLGAIGARSVIRLAELTGDIFQHPFTVTTAILEVKSDFLIAQRIMAGLVHNTSPAEVDRVQRQLLAQRDNVDRNMALVRGRFLGSRAEVDHVDLTLAAWRVARDETIELVRQGRRAEAIALNDGRNAQLADAVLKHVSDVSEFAYAKAESFKQQAEEESRITVWMIAAAILLTISGGIVVSLLVTRSVRNSVRYAVTEVQRVIDSSSEKARVAEAIGAGDLNQQITPAQPLRVDLHHLPDDEVGGLLKAAVRLSEVQSTFDLSFAQMTESLRHGRETEQAADWLKSGLNELNALMRGEQSSAHLADKVLSYLVRYLGAGVGALYLFDGRSEQLELTASFAMKRRQSPGDRIRLGEGLIGQAAKERRTICLGDVPADYLPIASALG
ncbi:MAG TPA: MCP four helix bundle domain-containing protein, partial [Rhodocyclaceae bacterium]|nr:MCP four helix bundle domain-containing protein [Rhodocyclaceae bacterium]